MAHPMFSSDMNRYRPDWYTEDHPEPEDPDRTLDAFHGRLQPGDKAYSATLMELAMLRFSGYDITDPDIVDKAIFIVEYRGARSERYAEDDAQRIKPEPIEPVVYYMRMRDLIKIGYTSQGAEKRRSALMADEVLAIEPGDQKLEHLRHKQFAHLRHQGERFYPEQELLDHIAMIREHYSDRQTPRVSGPTDGRNRTKSSDGAAA